MEIKSEFSTKKPAYPVLAAVAGAAIVVLCGCHDKKQDLGGSVPNPHVTGPKEPAPTPPATIEEPEQPQLLGGDVAAPGYQEG